MAEHKTEPKHETKKPETKAHETKAHETKAEPKHDAKHETKGHDTKGHDTKSAEHAEPKKGEVSAEVHEVTTALRGDLTKLAGPKADKLISHWQTMLEGLGDSGTKAVAADLGKLKALVSDESPDGAKIGKALGGLGDKVAKLAEDHGGVVGTALKSLAGVLHKGGESLAHATAEKA